MVNAIAMENNTCNDALYVYECDKCGKQFKNVDREGAEYEAEECCKDA